MKRVLEFDALRGLSAVLIMAAHISLIPATRWVVSLVDLFFVLSGYLITRNILKNRYAEGFLGRFFVRRALRIWPAYYFAFVACLLIGPRLKWDVPPAGWFYYLTFTQNVHDYLKIPRPSFSLMFQHTWTLAIEEQFYILWPLLLCRAGRRVTYAVILGFIGLAPAMRALGFTPYLLASRCDGLAFGSLLALLLSDPEQTARHLGRYRAAFLVTGLSALVVPPLFGFAESSFFTTRASMVYFGLAGTILLSQGHRLLRPLRDKRLCHLGTLSYGLYLYHPILFGTLPALYKRFLVRKLGLPANHILMDLAILVACVVVAELSRRWLEEPLMALKSRLTFDRTPSAPVYQGPHGSPRAEAVGLIRESVANTENRHGRSGN